jgi:hypothetical protein
MVNPMKKRGTAYESAVRDHAIAHRHKAFRPAQAGAGDLGDVHLDGLVALQCKDVTSWSVSGWMQDVEEQRQRAGLPFGAVIMKKRRASVGDSYVVMDYNTLLSLVQRLELAEYFVQADPHVRANWKKTSDDRSNPIRNDSA